MSAVGGGADGNWSLCFRLKLTRSGPANSAANDIFDTPQWGSPPPSNSGIGPDKENIDAGIGGNRQFELIGDIVGERRVLF